MNKVNNDLLKQTQDNYALLTNTLIVKNLSITTMESCTSGLIASLLTDVDNSSRVFKGSFVTYANESKIALGVSKAIINKYGVYSKETSIDMARVAKEKYNTDISIGVTGSLGIVDPNNLDSVKGEVYFTINYKTENTYFISIEDQGSKFLNKVYIANKICEELMKLI